MPEVEGRPMLVTGGTTGTGVHWLFKTSMHRKQFFFLKRISFKDFLFLKFVTDRFFSNQPGPAYLLNLKSHHHTLNCAALSPVTCRLLVLA